MLYIRDHLENGIHISLQMSKFKTAENVLYKENSERFGMFYIRKIQKVHASLFFLRKMCPLLCFFTASGSTSIMHTVMHTEVYVYPYCMRGLYMYSYNIILWRHSVVKHESA
jgi:hypothetical protein